MTVHPCNIVTEAYQRATAIEKLQKIEIPHLDHQFRNPIVLHLDQRVIR